MLVEETKKQGAELSKFLIINKEIIEDVILEVKENVLLAEDEINEAKKETKSTSRKVCWIVLIIILVVIAVILITIFSLK